MMRHFALLALAVSPLTFNRACPGVQFSPTSLQFSPQVTNPANPASSPTTVNLKNSGNAPLTIKSISSSGDFDVDNINCPVNNGSSIAAGASCTIGVSFSPNVVGHILGMLTITDNAIGSPHVLPLSGTGLAPAGFSPATLDFGAIALNSTSVAQSVTLTNNQSVALNISGITASGDYHVTSPLAPLHLRRARAAQ
jgi:hypothetical protein